MQMHRPCFLWSKICYTILYNMMRQAILDFPKQFAFKPRIERRRKVPGYRRFIVAGMGGSALPGVLFAQEYPDIPITIHRNYGLPYIADKELKKTLVVAVSYSGNTEEAIDAFQTAIDRGIDVCVISVGGKLLLLAQQHGIPYIQLPDNGIQPRAAIGFITMALAALLRRRDILKSLQQLAQTLRADEYESAGNRLAEQLLHKIPVVYASERNSALAYIWKITFNETSKIPAFCNVLPELNHNEMTGFDTHAGTRALTERFSFVMLQDADDHTRIKRRMEMTAKMFRDRTSRVEEISLEGASRSFRVFSSVRAAEWTAYHLARLYHVDPDAIPMVEEFKKLIAE